MVAVFFESSGIMQTNIFLYLFYFVIKFSEVQKILLKNSNSAETMSTKEN